MTTKPLGRFAALAGIVLLSGCVKATIAWAPLTPKGPEAEPSVLAALADQPAINTAEDWEARRPLVRDILSREIYGLMPTAWETVVDEHKIVDEAAYSALGSYEELRVEVTPHFDGMDEPLTDAYLLTLVVPKTPGPHPVIMAQADCGPWNTLPHPDAFRPEGEDVHVVEGLERYIFGRYVCAPPIEDILRAGYAYAEITVRAVIGGSAETSIEQLRSFVGPNADEQTRWGTIAAWSWMYSTTVDVLRADDRFDPNRIAAYGHSRHGKAALHAAGFDDRIAAVVSHQSGTGGASLNRDKAGETIAQITEEFSDWFAPVYATYAGREHELTLDQHHLVALVAPRPVMLGNSRRDVWSDPNGAIKAARGAAPIYSLYSDEVLKLDRLDEFDPNQTVSFWMRPGTHGVVEEDWPAFLSFLDAHLGD